MMKKIGLVVASIAAVAVIFVGARSFACDDAKHAKASKAATAEAKSCCPAGHATTDAALVTESLASDAKSVSAGDHCGTKSASMSGKSAMASSANSCASKANMASGKSCGTKSAMASSANSCASKADMASGKSCGTKSAMASNGNSCASKAELTGSKSCGSKSASMAGSCCPSDKAGASKAAYAANVFEVKDGHQYAVAQGAKFEVTPETPYQVVGNARYYFADNASMTQCAEKMAKIAADIDREAVALATSEANTVADNYGKKYGVCSVTNKRFLVTADSPVKVVDGQKVYSCSDDCVEKVAHPAFHTDNQTAH